LVAPFAKSDIDFLKIVRLIILVEKNIYAPIQALRQLSDIPCPKG
jgi:hypothetical protein